MVIVPFLYPSFSLLRRLTVLLVSSGAERGLKGLVFVEDFCDDKVIHSSADLFESGVGRIPVSRNLLLL